ncbi:MAG: hypothetical protein AB3X44_07790 [Leptothrix sp. (in: b-proteobacteria)]
MHKTPQQNRLGSSMPHGRPAGSGGSLTAAPFSQTEAPHTPSVAVTNWWQDHHAPVYLRNIYEISSSMRGIDHQNEWIGA